MYYPKHAPRRLPRGRAAMIGTVAAASGIGGFAAMATPAGASTTSAGTAPICTGTCAWQQIGEPSGYVMDVKGQDAAAGTPIIAWKGAAGDPAEDFTVVPAAGSGTSYVPAGGYQFASDTGGPGPNGTYWWKISDSPLSYSEASQSVGSQGVTLTTNPDQSSSSPYADSGVVVNLGTIAQNEDSNGNLVVPSVENAAGSTPSNVEINLFFATNGNNSQYGTFNSDDVYEGGLTTATPVPSGEDGELQDVTTSTVPASTYQPLENSTNGSGTEVWAWVGVSGSSPQTATIAKVGSDSLVNAVQGGNSYQIEYTPYTNLAGAQAAGNTAAEAAYNSDGTPKYCVSAVSDQSGVQAQLRDCATSANAWQDFLTVAGKSSHSMFEPTYGEAGVSAGADPMALNDSGYGKDGSPIIDYKATGTWNEEFWPAAS